MSQEDRLLTVEEFTECARGIPVKTDAEKAVEPWIFGAKLIQAQDTKSYAQALKDVGEWLEKEQIGRVGQMSYQILIGTVEALKQGKMPEGMK